MNCFLKKGEGFYLVLILIVINTSIFLYIFSKKSELLLLDFISFKSTNIVNSMIDNSIREILYMQQYEELINDFKDQNNNIVKLDFNNNEINKILYSVNENLLNNIMLLEKNENNDFKIETISFDKNIFYVPLGIISNTPILNSLGPRIPFKIDLIGAINNETKINIKEYGINSSLIELLLNINIKIKIVLPFRSNIININKSILLDSKIIQGKIPDYYGGLMSIHWNENADMI